MRVSPGEKVASGARAWVVKWETVRLRFVGAAFGKGAPIASLQPVGSMSQ